MRSFPSAVFQESVLWDLGNIDLVTVCHSFKRVSLYQLVIYWFCIVGEWFHIMERFGSFLSVQSWHICVGLVLGHWRVLVGFAWLESDGSLFLVVGVVSLVRRAVLRSFALGLQFYRDQPSLSYTVSLPTTAVIIDNNKKCVK